MAGIYLGSTDLSSATLYGGSTSVTKAYIGSNEVWSAPAVGYGTPTYDTGIQVYWDFANPASYPGSGTTVTDVQGNSNGTVVGTGWTYSAGSALGAIKKGATKAGQYIGASTSYFVGNPFNNTTFEFVWRATSTLSADNGFARWVAGTYGSDTAFEAALQQFGGSPVPNRNFVDWFSEEGVHPSAIYPAFTPTVNSWYHYVYVLPQGSNPRFYVNTTKTTAGGSAFGASNTFLWDGGNAALFGVDNNSAGVINNAELALFRMYNTAMSDSDVAANYSYFNTFFSF